MRINLNYKFLIMIFFIFLFIAEVYAIGVSPGRYTLDYEPGVEKKLDLQVLNSENKNLNLEITTRGNLGKYITLEKDKLSFSSSESAKNLGIVFNPPEDLEFGEHTGEIIITQTPEDLEIAGSHIDASLAVVTQLKVFVPYPGKYAEAELKVFGREPKKFAIAISNRGKERIEKAKARIEIFDFQENKIKELFTNEVSIETSGKKEILSEWEVDVEKGDYLAKVFLDYDGEEMYLEKEFQIGEQILDLKKIYVEDFELGKVAKFNMVVENKWNEIIRGAYAEMRVYDENLDEIDSFKSASYDIPSEMQTTINYYWDTQEISKGVYDANVIMHYSGKKTQQDLQLDVRQNKLEVIGVGYVISSEENEEGSFVKLMAIVLVILILLNLFWFIVLRRKIKKK